MDDFNYMARVDQRNRQFILNRVLQSRCEHDMVRTTTTNGEGHECLHCGLWEAHEFTQEDYTPDDAPRTFCEVCLHQYA